jgi:hypothetical protein
VKDRKPTTYYVKDLGTFFKISPLLILGDIVFIAEENDYHHVSIDDIFVAHIRKAR